MKNKFKTVAFVTVAGVIGLVPPIVDIEPVSNQYTLQSDLKVYQTYSGVITDLQKAIMPPIVVASTATSNSIGTMSFI